MTCRKELINILNDYTLRSTGFNSSEKNENKKRKKNGNGTLRQLSIYIVKSESNVYELLGFSNLVVVVVVVFH